MSGLFSQQADESKRKYGTNELAKKETESLWSMFTGTFDDIWTRVLWAALILKVILVIAGILHVVLTLVRADHTGGSCQEGTCAEMISSYIFLIQETEPGRSPESGGENLSGQNYHRISGCICFSDPGNSDIPGNISGNFQGFPQCTGRFR